jgi:hypothetical protein
MVVRYRGGARALASLLALLLLAPAGRARAEGSATAGQIHFNAGRAAYQQGHFADAAGEFQAAYDLDHLPGLLYNVARSHHNQYLLAPTDETLQRAMAAYRRYLAEAPQGRYRKEAIQALGELTLLVSRQAPPPAPAPPSPAPSSSPSSSSKLPPDEEPEPPRPAPRAPTTDRVTAQPLPPPVMAPRPYVTPYVIERPRRWVTPVVVVSVITVVGLALGLGLGLGLRHDGGSGGSLGKVTYPW